MSYPNVRYRHKKRGTVYELLPITDVWIEATETPAVVYQDIETGRVWVRPADEFFDEARFEQLPLEGQS